MKKKKQRAKTQYSTRFNTRKLENYNVNKESSSVCRKKILTFDSTHKDIKLRK